VLIAAKAETPESSFLAPQPQYGYRAEMEAELATWVNEGLTAPTVPASPYP